MATRTQIGDAIRDSVGDEYIVYLEHWADEAPDTVAIDGHACLVLLDPGTRTGHEAILALIGRLADALAEHDKAVEDIYAGLKVGDDATRVRLAAEREARCTVPLGTTGCHRVEHADGHHIAVCDYTVTAVRHESTLGVQPRSLEKEA